MAGAIYKHSISFFLDGEYECNFDLMDARNDKLDEEVWAAAYNRRRKARSIVFRIHAGAQCELTADEFPTDDEIRECLQDALRNLIQRKSEEKNSKIEQGELK